MVLLQSLGDGNAGVFFFGEEHFDRVNPRFAQIVDGLRSHFGVGLEQDLARFRD